MTDSTRWELPLAASIVLLATALRIGWPTLTEFKFSEARLVALVLEMTDKGRLPLVGVPSSAGFDHSPLSVYLYVPPFLLASDPIPATIYGGLVGAAAVALCWWLARRWPGSGSRGALIAALLLGISPWAVVFSRKIWQVTFVPLLTLAFVGLIVSALVTRSTPSNATAGQWHLAWGLATYALLVQVHPSAVSLAPALVLWLIIFRRQIRIVPLVTGLLLAGLTAVPFLIHQLQSGFPALLALRSLPAAEWDLSAFRLAWDVITGRNIHALAGQAYASLRTVSTLGKTFNLVGWFTAIASLGLLWRSLTRWKSTTASLRQTAQVDMILLSWLAIPILLNFRHSLDLHLHFFALVLPAAFLIVGRGAEFGLDAMDKAAPTSAKVSGIMGLVVLGLFTIAQLVALVLMARFVDTHDTPEGFGTPLARYLQVSGQAAHAASQLEASEVLIVGQGDSVVVDETPAIFDVLLRNRVTTRFVNGQDTALFPPHSAVALLTPNPGEAAEWYAEWPTQQLEAGYQLIALNGSWPQEPLQPVATTRTFENGIEFQSYYWEIEPFAQDDVTDQSSRFWLLWQVLWRDSQDTHFYVQLLDGDWSEWGQQDSAGYPTEYRQRGDRIINGFQLTPQAPGAGTPQWARAGLYLYPEIANLSVIDAAGNSVGDAVIMGPLPTVP
jgi:hypothetical protein